MNGDRALCLHIIHMSIVVFVVVISVLLGDVFGMDSIDEYSIMYAHGSYTLLAHVHGVIIMLFLVLVVLLTALNALPYTVLFWLNWIRKRNKSNGVAVRGIILTMAVLVLIAVDPYVTIHLTGLTAGSGENWSKAFWSIIFSILFLAVYVIPSLLLRFSYTEIQRLKKYSLYKKVLILQAALYSLLVLYWNTPLPGMLRHFMDSRFLY